MTIIIKSALVAAILAAASAGALADTGRPTDYVAPIHRAPIDRHADDAFTRYQRVVDGASRTGFDTQAEADRQEVDAYATYLMVVDGMARDAAIQRARLRRQSVEVMQERRLARASR